MSNEIYYSDKYYDDKYEYRVANDTESNGLNHIFPKKENCGKRHVMLPKELCKLVPKSHLMSEAEWRSIGVQQSQGWIHYMKHDPEPHILLFRREQSKSLAPKQVKS